MSTMIIQQESRTSSSTTILNHSLGISSKVTGSGVVASVALGLPQFQRPFSFSFLFLFSFNFQNLALPCIFIAFCSFTLVVWRPLYVVLRLFFRRMFILPLSRVFLHHQVHGIHVHLVMDTWYTDTSAKSSRRDMLPLSIKSWIFSFKIKQSSIKWLIIQWYGQYFRLSVCPRHLSIFSRVTLGCYAP